MKILLISSEARSALAIRDFFRFYQTGGDFLYLHLSTELDPLDNSTNEVYGLFSHYQEIKPQSSDLNGYLKDPELGAIVYADLEDNHDQTAPCMLYSCSFLNLLIGPVTSSGWMKLEGMKQIRLSNETGNPGDQKLDQLLKHPEEEQLLSTSKQDLADLILGLDPQLCSIFYPAEPIPSLNLNLNAFSRAEISKRLGTELFVLEQYLLRAQQRGSDGLCLLRSSQHRRTESVSQAYSFFAAQYDSYMSHVDYESWANNVIKWQAKHSSNKCNNILEIACGTANVSSILCSRGYQVEACDRSPQMLEAAFKKPVKPLLFRRSMTEELPRRDYDLVICLFDSINYLQSRTEIMKLFEAVYEALAPGGIFIFDISTLYNSLENFADTFNLSASDQGFLLHQAEYDEFSHKQKSYLLNFTKHPAGYSLDRERHVQRVYRSYELVELIESSKFRFKALYCSERPQNLINQKNRALDEKYPRLFYVLSKESSGA